MVLLDISHYKCPNCKETIEVDKIQDFNTRLCKRETIECPSCKSTLNWEKKTHNLAHYPLWVAFLISPILVFYSFPIGISIFFISMILSAIGMMTKYLVVNKIGHP